VIFFGSRREFKYLAAGAIAPFNNRNSMDESKFIKKFPDFLTPKDVFDFLKHIPPGEERKEALFPIIFDMTEEQAMQSFDFGVFERRRKEREVDALKANMDYFLNHQGENPEMCDAPDAK
jgi:hypothetical protein